MPSLQRPVAKKSYRTKRILYIVFGLLVLVIGLTIVAVRIKDARTVSRQKADFAQAEADIAAINRSIVAKLGTPLKNTTEKYCSRPNMKFNEGQLSCSIEMNIYYPSNDPSSANKISIVADRLAASRFGIFKKTSSQNMLRDSFTSIDPVNYAQNYDYQQIFGVATGQRNSTAMNCRMTHTYYLGSRPPFSEFPNLPDVNITATQLSCSKSTTTEIFNIVK